jgi:hypothetical protein
MCLEKWCLPEELHTKDKESADFLNAINNDSET